MKKDQQLEALVKSVRHSQAIDLSQVRGSSDLPPHFKATQAFESTLATLYKAKRLQAALALVTGAHGAGKTTTLQYFERIEPSAHYWQCKPSYHAKHLLSDICSRVGINAGRGWEMQTSIIATQLKGHTRLFLLDEAQRLNYEGLDLLKWIADETGSTFVLCASPSLEKRIDKWPDIATRCKIRARVQPMEVDELYALYKDDGYSEEVIGEIHHHSQGVMRTVAAIMQQIEFELEYQNTRSPQKLGIKDLEAAHIRVVAEKVVG